MIALDIISDPICPWCYIGKARLDRGVAQAGNDPFTRRWRIFQLNPDMPPEGMDRHRYLTMKFGEQGAREVYDRIAAEAEASGVAVRFDRIARTPNTMDAHRLIRWSQTTGNQDAVVNQLFVRYFERGEDISDREVLADVAETAGMERDVVAALLAGDADREELAAEEAEARRMGVGGVPTFIVANRYVLQGAQEAETWARVTAEVAQAVAAEDAAPAGDPLP